MRSICFLVLVSWTCISLASEIANHQEEQHEEDELIKPFETLKVKSGSGHDKHHGKGNHHGKQNGGHRHPHKRMPSPVHSGAGGVGLKGVSVSGISSGGFAAVQFHVCFSSEVVGAGIVAAGPFYASSGNVATALAVMQNPALISLPTLYAATQYAQSTGAIDNVSNLANSRVWLFSGQLDTVVRPGVVKKLHGFYGHYVDTSHIKTVFNVPAEHAMITNNYGQDCSTLGSPYINNCNFDAAGQLLSWIYNRTLAKPSKPVASHIQALDQADYVPTHCSLFSLTQMGLYQTAYAYVPTQCRGGAGCAVHVAFHGCGQTIGQINSTYYMNAGYNQWAEANPLIVLYPQATVNTNNPQGCFDWWGFSGVNFASQLGCQMSTIKAMTDYMQTI